MEPHQQRVVDEKSELDAKSDKLFAFMKSERFNDMGREDRGLLFDQLKVMDEYSDVLKKRIERFAK